tara:strand:- start:132 stop:1247 length:1116 start_codon:yes stop_codon:yes gene_type:complete
MSADVAPGDRLEALYDYFGEDTNKLRFKRGDVLILREVGQGGWALGLQSSSGKLGYFPLAYTKKIIVNDTILMAPLPPPLAVNPSISSTPSASASVLGTPPQTTSASPKKVGQKPRRGLQSQNSGGKLNYANHGAGGSIRMRPVSHMVMSNNLPMMPASPAAGGSSGGLAPNKGSPIRTVSSEMPKYQPQGGLRQSTGAETQNTTASPPGPVGGTMTMQERRMSMMMMRNFSGPQSNSFSGSTADGRRMSVAAPSAPTGLPAGLTKSSGFHAKRRSFMEQPSQPGSSLYASPSTPSFTRTSGPSELTHSDSADNLEEEGEGERKLVSYCCQWRVDEDVFMESFFFLVAFLFSMSIHPRIHYRIKGENEKGA